MRPARHRGLTRRGFLYQSAAGPLAAGVTAALPVGAAEIAASPPTDQWPDYRNGADLRGIANTTLSDELTLQWERPADDGCKSTAAVIGGQVYIGTLSGELLCLDLASGEERWKYKSLEANDPKTFIPGFSAPVTVAGDVVLCGDEEGLLHCVDRRTGGKRWTFNAEGLIVGGAAVRGDRVIVGGHSQFLYGLNLQTGEKQWEFNANGPINGTQAFEGDLTFVTGCSEPVLYVVDTRTGEEHARVPLEDLLIATPALADGILYFGTSEGRVLAVDWKAQTTVWKFETQQPREVHSAPAVTADAVVIATRDKSLYCLDRKTGAQRWAFRTRAGNDNSPVVVGGRVYFGSGDKFLYGVGLADGQEQWKFGAGVSFTESSPAIAAGRLVIGTDGPNGRILCFG